MGGSGAATQGGGKKKKNHGHDRPQSGATVAAAAAGVRNECGKHPRQQRSSSGSCPVYPNSRHNTSECREILKLAKRISERREQASKYGSPPRRRPGEREMCPWAISKYFGD
jgi:replicative superfamily II helicase